MENDIYDEIFKNTWQPVLSLGDIFKVPLILVVLGNVFYSLMLFLKFKTLVDTIDSRGKYKIKILVYANLLVSLIAGIVGTFIIILG